MQIRKIRDSEWAAAGAVLAHLRPEWDSVTLPAARGALQSKGVELWGVFDPDLRGLLSVRPTETDSIGTVGRIEDIVVAPNHRYLGYGSILIETLERESVPRKWAGLEVAEANAGADFWDAQGFTATASGFEKLAPGVLRAQAQGAPSAQRRA